jgi:glucosamine--fructose-6-phosphate aminotransferase (isomerizing)
VEITHAAAEINAPVWALVQEGDEELGALVAEAMTLPAVDELWSPFVYVLPLQLLTYYLALAKGCQPDRFRRDDPAFAAAHSHYVL